MNEEEPAGFLSRWSRRKQAAVRGEAVPEAPPEPAPDLPTPAPAEVAPLECVDAAIEPEPEPEFDVASLPPVESLDAHSDFTVFLQRGVPEALRNAALRKAWVADPLIRDHMSPLDYAWDFNTPGGLPHGFASTLAETGEALRKLIAQAIGEIEPEAEKTGEEPGPEGLVLAEAPPPPEAEAGDAPLEEAASLPPPDLPLRLTDQAPLAVLPVAEAEPVAPRRRHGGALPV